jgi:4-alpha-glucanotransferase
MASDPASHTPGSPGVHGRRSVGAERSPNSSWGIGDLADLRRLASWSATAWQTGLLLVNPLSAALSVLPQQPSPYFPSSRSYRNLLYLRMEEIPGAAGLGADLEHLAATGRALNQEHVIDRDAIFQLKVAALAQIWQSFGGDPAFEQYCKTQGEALKHFAVFSTLAEHYSQGWCHWPAAYRHPHAPAVERFAAAHRERVRFHQWVQWLLNDRLARVAAALPVLQDLPIGVDPNGADAWIWQDLLATEVTVGAPPDEYNTMDAHGLLSYRLLWFETEPPSHYPARALAAVTTHDLPTTVGLWSGADLQAQHDLGLQPNTAGLEEIRQRLQAMTSLPDAAAVDEVVLRTPQLLAEAPSAVIMATLEDALAVAERPNMPSTTAEWPNWSRALPPRGD